jgi:hypothetical protein
MVESRNPPHLLEPFFEIRAMVPSNKSLRAMTQIIKVPMKKSPLG